MRYLAALTIAFNLLHPLAVSAAELSDVAGHYVIDPSSTIAFEVGQVGGGGISGQFADFSGFLDLDPKDVGHSHVSFVLRPASVTTGQARVDSFLKSGAVFDAAEYPEIKFRSVAVQQTSDDSARVTGEITARNVTYKAAFDVRLDGRSGRQVSFKVTGQVPRLPFGMGIGVPIYDNMVAFDMTLSARRG